MSIQAALNADSMKSIPKIKEIIAKAEPFEANQMEHRALQEMMNSLKPIVDMDGEELEKFQSDLIDVFKFKHWI